MKNTNVIVRNAERLISIFGFAETAKPEEVNEVRNNRKPVLGYFSEREIGNFPGMDIKTAFISDNPYQFVGYIQKAAENNAKIIRDNSLLRTMAPEITKAERILVSSVLSPNDMQTNRIPMEMLPVEGVTEPARNEILEAVQNFYNEDLEFGVRIPDWLASIFFKEGSKAVMVLPKAVLRAMSNAQDLRNGLDLPPEIQENSAAIEHWNLTTQGMKPALEALNKIPNLDTNKSEDGVISMEDMIESMSTDITLKDSVVLQNAITEAYSQEMPEFALEQKNIDMLTQSALKGVNSFIRQHKAQIQIGRNPFAIRQIGAKTAEFISQTERDIFSVYKKGVDETVMLNIPENNRGTKATDTAIIVEFPSEAVIPIAVPGSVQSHLGYLVLTGGDYTPVGNASQIVGRNSTSGVIQANARAMMDDQKLSEALGSFYNRRDLAMTAVFGVALKNILQTELGKYGLQNMSPAQYNAVSSCVFNYIAMDQQVRIIFVPASMMCYYSFFHRPDGTGKSVIEDCSTILALRTTLITAYILSQMRNAIDRRKITMDFAGKTLNPEAAMSAMKELYGRETFVGFTNEPTVAARNMSQQGLVIVPKGIPGLPDNMDINVEPGSPTHTQVETGAIWEQLTNMFIDFLIVPHNAMNKLSEDEFAKTVATNHVYFCNQLRNFQREVNEKTTKLIRTHLRFSYTLQQKIMGILKKYQTVNKESSPDQKDVTTNMSIILGNIINAISVKLPPPNMSVSKAQFEEVKSYCESLDELMKMTINTDMIPSNELTTDGAIKVIQAHMKARMAREYMKTVGTNQMFKVPELSTFDYEEIDKIVQQMIDVVAGVRNHYASFSKTTHNPGDGFGSNGSGDLSGGSDLTSGGSGSSVTFGEGDDNSNAENSGDASTGSVDNALTRLDQLSGA